MAGRETFNDLFNSEDGFLSATHGNITAAVCTESPGPLGRHISLRGNVLYVHILCVHET